MMNVHRLIVRFVNAFLISSLLIHSALAEGGHSTVLLHKISTPSVFTEQAIPGRLRQFIKEPELDHQRLGAAQMKSQAQQSRWARLPSKNTLRVTSIGLFYALLSQIVTNGIVAIYYAFNIPTIQQSSYSPSMHTVILVFVLVPLAAFEEYTDRVILFKKLRQWLRPTTANILQAIVFSGSHYILRDDYHASISIPLFFSGLFFGNAYRRAGFRASLTAHWMFNLVASMGTFNPFTWTLVLPALALANIVLVWLGIRQKDATSAAAPITEIPGDALLPFSETINSDQMALERNQRRAANIENIESQLNSLEHPGKVSRNLLLNGLAVISGFAGVGWLLYADYKGYGMGSTIATLPAMGPLLLSLIILLRNNALTGPPTNITSLYKKIAAVPVDNAQREEWMKRLEAIYGSFTPPAKPKDFIFHVDGVLDEGIATDTLDAQSMEDLEVFELIGTPQGMSSLGRSRFEWLVLHPYLDSAYIHSRQEVVSELINHRDYRADLGRVFKTFSESRSFSSLLNSLNKPTYFDALRRFTRTALPLVVLMSLGAILAAIHVPGSIVFVGVTTGILFLGLNKGYLQFAQERQAMKEWEALFKSLPDLRQALKQSRTPLMVKARNELDALFDATSANMLFMLSQNFSLPNLTMAYRTQADDLRRVVALVAEIEAFLGMAEFSIEEDTVHAMPVFLNEASPALSLQGVRPPWIDGSRASGNDVELKPGQNFWAVTGTQHSGKSTLLRTVGLNVIRAQIGMPVTAHSAQLTPIRLRTQFSMSDKPLLGKSLFDMENERLTHSLNLVDKNPSYLLLFDELMRGTNSVDKGLIQTTTIPWLIKRGALTLMGTHDLEITKLPGVTNWHFQDGEPPSYRLHKGVVHQTNAIRLFLDQIPGISEIQEGLAQLAQRVVPHFERVRDNIGDLHLSWTWPSTVPYRLPHPATSAAS